MSQIKNLKQLLLLALLIRLLIIPFYFQPDIKTYHFQAYFLREGVFNIYQYLDMHKSELTLKEEFVYFPLTYFFLGGYQTLVSPLLGNNFYTWVSDASSQTFSEAVGIYRYLFLLKLPYLILDITIAFLLMSFFKDPTLKKRAFIFWLFNPFTIVLIYIFSNVDIIPVTLTLLSLLLMKQKKLLLSGVVLGVAAGFKAYPLLFLPFILLYSNHIRQIIMTVGTTLLTVALIVLPFWSSSFQKATLVSGLTTRIVFPGLSIGFGETLMVGIISMSALFFFIQINKQKNYADLWKVYLAFLLLLFSFIHFHIQWLLWVAPFFVILLTENKNYRFIGLTLILLAFSIPMLYEDKSMSVALLSVYSYLYNLLPIPFAFVQKIYDPYVVQSVLHSILAGGSLVLIWKIFKEERV